MPGRHALIVPAEVDDDGVVALVDVLKRRKVGGYRVQTADALEEVEAFCGDRARADAVFVYVAERAPVSPREVSAALKDCPSRHVLVVLESAERIAPDDGRAILSGASAGAVAGALEDADTNQDGVVAARELFRVRRSAAPKDRQPVLRSKLHGTFKVADSRHPHPPRPPRGPTTPLLVGGIVLLLGGLLLPWLYGGSGLKLALWPGTVVDLRVAGLAVLALAALAAVFVIRGWRAWWLLVAACGATYGCVLAWFWSQERAEYGFGIVVSVLGPVLILAAAGLRIFATPAKEAADPQGERYAAGASAFAGVLMVIEVSPAIATDYIALVIGLLGGVPLLIPRAGRLRALAPMFAGSLILAYDVFGPLALYPLFGALAAMGTASLVRSKV